MPDPFSVSKEGALERIRQSILAVAPDYFVVHLPGGSRKHQERVFAYELYHQLRVRFTEHWYVNGEFRKGLSLIPRVERTDWIIPDIVIHQPHTLERNLVALEIKSDPAITAANLLEDVKKLEMLTDPHQGLGFQIGVMLAVNADFETVLANAPGEVQRTLVQVLEKGPRVAIWNIAEPIANGQNGSGSLSSESLKIFRANDVRALVERFNGGE